MVGLEGKFEARSVVRLCDANGHTIQATKLAKEYEKQGGGYENDPDSKNQPKKGAPEKKE